MLLPRLTEPSPENRGASRRREIPGTAMRGLLAVGLLSALLAQAVDSSSSRDYELTTETVMPHLEEALRYATTQERRCLSPQELASAFPILRHDSLKGCRLAEESRRDDTVSYLLICEGGNGTTGSALWQLGEERLTGRLDVKLGGKNMTFTQRVTARPLGNCVPEPR